MNNILQSFLQQLAKDVNSCAYFQQGSKPVQNAENLIMAWQTVGWMKIQYRETAVDISHIWVCMDYFSRNFSQNFIEINKNLLP
jgi:hypothetical protein